MEVSFDLMIGGLFIDFAYWPWSVSGAGSSKTYQIYSLLISKKRCTKREEKIKFGYYEPFQLINEDVKDDIVSLLRESGVATCKCSLDNGVRRWIIIFLGISPFHGAPDLQRSEVVGATAIHFSFSTLCE